METEENPASDSLSTTWLLVYTAGALVAIYMIHHLYKLTHFWRLGIPGPVPIPLIGNMLSIMIYGFINVYVDWRKKYGKHFGVFSGNQAALVICDADIAKQILIKEFPSFQGRNNQQISIPYLNDSLIVQEGEPWKRGRSYMSPTFSGSKMKQIIPSINGRCDVLMEVINKKYGSGESFEIREFLGAYVMDCVACCAFGIKADCQRDPDDIFLKHAKSLIDFDLKNIGFLLRVMFPSLSPILDPFRVFDLISKDALDFFADIVQRATELRKEGGRPTKKDFLQLMMDAVEAGEDEPSKVGEEDGQRTNGVVKKNKIPMTTKELIGQSIVFFFAGYDTVSQTLSFMAYALATNPEVQKKVQEEIDEMIPEGEPIEYDMVTKMEYLDKVWNEAQRVWPVGFVLERTCNKDFSYKGLNIPAGQYVQVNVWDIHHNAEYWSDPQTFNPENFSKEAKETRQPCAFMPFGAGPRNCVGMRFAILESKIGMIRILQKYSFETTSETKDLSDVSNLGIANLYPKKGIHLCLVPRD